MRARRLFLYPLALGALSFAVACGDDDDSDATPTPDDGATVVEQGTVANLGPYRIGVYRVDADQQSALVSITRVEGEKVGDSTLVIGTPHHLPDGVLELLATTDGDDDDRDTIRLRFTTD